MRLRDRKVLWERNHRPDATSATPTDVTAPVYHDGVVFFAYVDGRLVAVDAKTGAHRTGSTNLDSHLESSPVVVGDRLYLGDDKTNVVAVRASDGKVLWQFNSPGAIKASPSYHDGRVYVADYEGSVFCLDADSGKPLWRTNTTKVEPFGEGGFYSSPAIAFGRVYAARDDGTVFAFDLEQRPASTGPSRPTTSSTGRRPSRRSRARRPTVYIGSYDEHLYALDARSGRQRVEIRRRRRRARHGDRDRPHRLHLELQDRRDDRDRRPHPPQDLLRTPGRLHAGDLRRPPPLPDRLLRR